MPDLLLLLQSGALPAFTQPVIVGIMLAYFIVTAGIGVWATRRTKNARDFFVAGQGIGVVTMAVAAMAATLSGFTFIGGPGLIYSIGLGAIFINLPLSITTAMGGWVLGKRLRLLSEVRPMLTIPDAIGARYRSRAAQGLSAVAILIAIAGYLATNFLALGFALDAVFGCGLTWGIWIGVAFTLAYSVGGGILAGVYTDLFQGTVMALASLLVVAVIWRVSGGVTALTMTIMSGDPAFLSPWGKVSPLAALSFFFVFGIGTLGQPHVVHKFYMLRDPRRLKWYPLVMTVAMSMTLLLMFGVGLAVKAMVLSGEMPPLARADDATPQFLLRFAPLALAGIVFAGVAAAIMSTVNAFMSVGSAAISHDLPRALGITVRNPLRWGRVGMGALSVVGALLALQSRTLVAFLGIFGWGLLASTLVPALAIGLNWRGATRAGALASIVTGIAVTLTLETMAYYRIFTFPAGVTATALALVSALLVFFGVSFLTRRSADGDLDPDVAVVMDA
jgi:Na+/proline symporter